MSKARQTTLSERWGSGTGNSNQGTEAGAGTSSSSNNTMRPPPNPGRGGGTGRGRGGARGGGRGKGRGGRGGGRGRGGGSSTVHSSSNAPELIQLEDEDDDAILEQAMMNYELTSNSISREFQELNAATELPGFERTAGDIWIYPTNRQVRDYQFNIVKTALYHNTLVSLPTGLGKTFIAAVVMYNFHRWYPNNLIIFMAPTKPLVTQQLDACHNIMGIKPRKMIELTGQIPPKKREEIWKEKKVFFLTPQVLTSDLNRGFCPAESIRCIVVDEAHKAQGNYAYSQVISMVVEKNKCFRILALSATPGNDLTAVQGMLKNLLIAKIELRTETSYDILPYTHQKTVETVVVPIDKHIKEVQDKVIEIFQRYTGKLMKDKFLTGKDGYSFTQFQLVKARDTAREKLPPNFPTYQKKAMEIDFNTCITLAHGIDLLIIHGLRSFFNFMNGVIEKSKGNPVVAAELKRTTNIEEILSDVQAKLNISADNSVFDLSTHGLFSTTSPKPRPNSSIVLNPSHPNDYLLSHPKMLVLKNLVAEHFKKNSPNTRIMIFSQYRDSVQEIGNMLNSLGPDVRPMVFFGQAKAGPGGTSLKQKDQALVVQRFRSGGFNVLVSTSVGEEGLDIGEVDLIICFDSSRSPTRLVQRMGRTGRQRQGKTIFLLTQGKEERMYYSSVQQQSSISRNITDASILESFLYKESPRMVPVGVTPKCYKMDIILSSEQNHIPPTQIEPSGSGSSTPPVRANVFGKASKNLSKGKDHAVKKPTKSISQESTSPDENEETYQSPTTQKQLKKIPFLKPKATIPEVQIPTIPEVNDEQPTPLQMHEEEAAYDGDLMNDTYDTTSEPTVGYGQYYHSYLLKMLSVQEVTSGTTSRCVFLTNVPNEKEPLLSDELQNLNPEELRSKLENINMDVIREKLNIGYTLGPTSRCSCGMYNEDFNNELNFDDPGDFECDNFTDPGLGEHGDELGNNINNLLPDPKLLPTNSSLRPIPKISGGNGNRSLFVSQSSAMLEVEEPFEQADMDDGGENELSLADVDIAMLFDDDFDDANNEEGWIGEDPKMGVETKHLSGAETDFEDDQDGGLSTPSTTFGEDELRELDALEPILGYSSSSTKPKTPISPVKEPGGFLGRVRSNSSPSKLLTLQKPISEPLNIVLDSDSDDELDILPPSPPKPKKKFIFKKSTQPLPLASSNQFNPKPNPPSNANLQSQKCTEFQHNMPVSTTSSSVNSTNNKAEDAEADSSNKPIFSGWFGQTQNKKASVQIAREPLLLASLKQSTPKKKSVYSFSTTTMSNNKNQTKLSSSSDEECLPSTPPQRKKFVFKKKSSEFTVPEIPILGQNPLSNESGIPTLRQNSILNVSEPVRIPAQVLVNTHKFAIPQNPKPPKVSPTNCSSFPRKTLFPSGFPASTNKSIRKETSSFGTSYLQSSIVLRASRPVNYRTTDLINRSPTPTSSPYFPSTSGFPQSSTPITQANESRVSRTVLTPTTTNNSSPWISKAITPTASNHSFTTPSTSGSNYIDNTSPSPFQRPGFMYRKKSLQNGNDQVPSNNPTPQRKRRRKKRNVNPFIESQAEVSGSDTEGNDSDDSELDAYDRSFVDEGETENIITDSQQVRYIKSIANVSPLAESVNRIVRRIEAAHNGQNDEPHDSSGTTNDDEMESFCVPNNEIEFEEIGVFTQAMFNAAEEIATESPGANRFKRKLRSKTKLEYQNKSSKYNGKNQKRRRIRMLSDSDSE